MEPSLQFGIGIAVVILILDRVFAFLLAWNKRRNGTPQSDTDHETAGKKSVDFWRNSQKEILASALEISVIPILEVQTRILDELRGLSARHGDMLLRAQIMNEELRTSQDKIHASLRIIERADREPGG